MDPNANAREHFGDTDNTPPLVQRVTHALAHLDIAIDTRSPAALIAARDCLTGDMYRKEE